MLYNYFIITNLKGEITFMNKSDKDILKKICEYCITNYSISNSSPIISSLIYELCKFHNIDAIPVQGIITICINNIYSRSFAHCFNVYDGIIIDASIYEYALINKRIEHLIPMYIVDHIPYHIEYSIQNPMSEDYRFKFSKEFLSTISNNIKFMDHIHLKRFNLTNDSKKQNLFYCH